MISVCGFHNRRRKGAERLTIFVDIPVERQAEETLIHLLEDTNKDVFVQIMAEEHRIGRLDLLALRRQSFNPDQLEKHLGVEPLFLNILLWG